MGDVTDLPKGDSSLSSNLAESNGAKAGCGKDPQLASKPRRMKQ